MVETLDKKKVVETYVYDTIYKVRVVLFFFVYLSLKYLIIN